MIVGCDEKSAERISSLLRKGGVAVIPTDTLYALSASIYNEEGVRRIYQLKKREEPLPVGVSSIRMMGEIAYLNDTAVKLVKTFMPGPLTLVLPKRKVPDYVSREGVAVRIPNHNIALKIIEEVGPITLTSANVHGGRNPVSIDIAIQQLGDEVDIYMDCGKLGGRASTILDLRNGIRILREGPISMEEIMEVLDAP